MENKKIIILIGPPGCGKGTQGEILAEKTGGYYFETSKIIEDKFNNASSDDTVLMVEKAKWEKGILNSPELVREWVVEKVRALKGEGRGIVFSGSPRTLPEAEVEVPILEELYGKENIKILHIALSPEESYKRNTNRRICVANRHPIPDFEEFKNIITCPKDGSRLIKRKGLDDPETLVVRNREYRERTEPVLDYLRDRGYAVVEIDGEQPINNVAQDILDSLSK